MCPGETFFPIRGCFLYVYHERISVGENLKLGPDQVVRVCMYHVCNGAAGAPAGIVLS